MCCTLKAESHSTVWTVSTRWNQWCTWTYQNGGFGGFRGPEQPRHLRVWSGKFIMSLHHVKHSWEGETRAINVAERENLGQTSCKHTRNSAILSEKPLKHQIPDSLRSFMWIVVIDNHTDSIYVEISGRILMWGPHRILYTRVVSLSREQAESRVAGLSPPSPDTYPNSIPRSGPVVLLWPRRYDPRTESAYPSTSTLICPINLALRCCLVRWQLMRHTLLSHLKVWYHMLTRVIRSSMRVTYAGVA